MDFGLRSLGERILGLRVQECKTGLRGFSRRGLLQKAKEFLDSELFDVTQS